MTKVGKPGQVGIKWFPFKSTIDELELTMKNPIFGASGLHKFFQVDFIKFCVRPFAKISGEFVHVRKFLTIFPNILKMRFYRLKNYFKFVVKEMAGMGQLGRLKVDGDKLKCFTL